MTEKKSNKPEDIQKEFEDFIQKKFGSGVKVFTKSFFPGSNAHEERAVGGEEAVQEATQNRSIKDFHFKPKQIKAYLDRFVIGQDDAKVALAIAVCDHYNHVSALLKGLEKSAHAANPPAQKEYHKQNVLITGPTGSGKTYMIKQIAKLIGVPFVKADATRFSETGYVGANVDDLIKDLVHEADGDIERAQFGIVYLDEADKLASPKERIGRDVNGRGVQFGLLKLMEETDVDLKAAHDPASQMQAFMEMQQKGRVEKKIISTKHILFIVSGAFTGLEDIIARRLNKKSIGFAALGSGKFAQTDALLKHAATNDFIEYGFEPEFVARLPIRVACEHLDASALFNILKHSEETIINQYVEAFWHYGIKLQLTDDALYSIAEIAAEEKTGARALMTVCEKIFRDFKFELPSTDASELLVTKELIQEPQATLAAILERAGADNHNSKKEILLFEEDFKSRHGMRISFDAEAIRFLISESTARQIPIYMLCEELLMSYEHGLKLIQQNTGQQIFILTIDCVKTPKPTLERMITESYKKI